jgi:hypothetical protein
MAWLCEAGLVMADFPMAVIWQILAMSPPT